MSELLEAVRAALARARELGAGDAECTASEGEEFSAGVRMQQVENLKQAGSRAAGIRVLLDQGTGRRAGSSYTSDLSRGGLDSMVRAAMALAKVTTADPHAGLPEAEQLGQLRDDLKLFDPAIAAMDTEWKIGQAMEAEAAALAADPRIQNSEGASFESYLGVQAFANSRGFEGCYRTSSCSLSVVPVARANGGMERDYWHSASRHAAGLEPPGLVGRRAAERVLRRLNPRKVATQKAPVIYEWRAARGLLSEIFPAVNGSAIYKQASFLAGMLGERIASEHVTVIDDATLPGLFGSCPFDDEGVASRRTVVIEKGVLKSYLLNTYTARKLGLKTTGNASRGITGNPGVGPGNFYLEAGTRSREELIAGVRNGLYVTETIGGGANTVTGDYSCGASGLWIENGQLAYPVSGITIAGNLKDMLMNLEQIASDLEFRGSLAAPTLLIGEMTVSGQ